MDANTSRVFGHSEIKDARDMPGFGGDLVSDEITASSALCGKPAYWTLHSYHEAALVAAAAIANRSGILSALASMRQLARLSGLDPETLQRGLLVKLYPANLDGLHDLREATDIVDVTYRTKEQA